MALRTSEILLDCHAPPVGLYVHLWMTEEKALELLGREPFGKGKHAQCQEVVAPRTSPMRRFLRTVASEAELRQVIEQTDGPRVETRHWVHTVRIEASISEYGLVAGSRGSASLGRCLGIPRVPCRIDGLGEIVAVASFSMYRVGDDRTSLPRDYCPSLRCPVQMTDLQALGNQDPRG